MAATATTKSKTVYAIEAYDGLRDVHEFERDALETAQAIANESGTHVYVYRTHTDPQLGLARRWNEGDPIARRDPQDDYDGPTERQLEEAAPQSRQYHDNGEETEASIYNRQAAFEAGYDPADDVAHDVATEMAIERSFEHDAEAFDEMEREDRELGTFGEQLAAARAAAAAANDAAYENIHRNASRRGRSARAAMNGPQVTGADLREALATYHVNADTPDFEAAATMACGSTKAEAETKAASLAAEGWQRIEIERCADLPFAPENYYAPCNVCGNALTAQDVDAGYPLHHRECGPTGTPAGFTREPWGTYCCSACGLMDIRETSAHRCPAIAPAQQPPIVKRADPECAETTCARVGHYYSAGAKRCTTCGSPRPTERLATSRQIEEAVDILTATRNSIGFLSNAEVYESIDRAIKRLQGNDA